MKGNKGLSGPKAKRYVTIHAVCVNPVKILTA